MESWYDYFLNEATLLSRLVIIGVAAGLIIAVVILLLRSSE